MKNKRLGCSMGLFQLSVILFVIVVIIAMVTGNFEVLIEALK